MSKTQALILILTILLSAFFGSIPQAHQPAAMKRESQPLSYLAALDLSYQHGAGAVDWSSVQWPKVAR